MMPAGGDRVTLHDQRCACGSVLPVIEVTGRHQDSLRVGPPGKRAVTLLPLAISTVLEEQAGLFDFQLVQQGPQDLVLHTGLRSVVSPSGQRVSALDKLHLLDGSRVLIIWGDRDPMIPVAHGRDAHAALEGSRFVVFPGASHEPHLHDPDRFAELVVGHVNAH